MRIPEIEIIPAMEVPGGLVAYALSAEGLENTYDDQLQEPGEITAWKRSVQSEITPFLDNDVRFFFSYATHYYLLCRLIMRRGLREIPELLSFLRNMSVDEFTAMYKTIIQSRAGSNDAFSYQAILESLEYDRSSNVKPFEEEAAHIESLFCCPAEFKNRYVSSIEDFTGQFISPGMNGVMQFLEEKKLEHEKLIEKDPKDFLDKLKPGVDIQNFKLVIGYYNARALDGFLGNETFIIYGFAHEQRFTDSDIRKKTDLYLQALGDPKRLAVMRLLKDKPYYGKELAEALGITTATVSYHLEKLSTAGLISVRTSDKNRIYYALHKEGIGEMVDSLRTEFL